MHPGTSLTELEELSSLLQVEVAHSYLLFSFHTTVKVPLVAGTVNRGSDVIASGIVANDWSAFCGLDTTTTEIAVRYSSAVNVLP